MILYVSLDIGFMQEWDISTNAGIILSHLVQFPKWATILPYSETIKEDTLQNINKDEYYKNPFYLCYLKKIINDIPILPSSKSSITKYIKELEEKEMIEYIRKNSTPAIRLTQKGKSWGEFQYLTKTKEHIEVKEKNSFNLSRQSNYENLSKEYKEKLKIKCVGYSKKRQIPETEFEKFVAYHRSKGSKYINWLMAYVTWCNNYSKWNKTNEGENNGFYTG